MRLVSFTPKARQIVVTLGEIQIPGVMVEGVLDSETGGVTLSNFFLPVVNCDLQYYNGVSFNGDMFAILNQFGLKEGPEGSVIIAPSDAYNDYVLVFFEFLNADKLVLPKKGGPEFIKRLEFDDNELDVFILVLKRNTKTLVYSFTRDDKILEYQFNFDYMSGEVS